MATESTESKERLSKSFNIDCWAPRKTGIIPVGASLLANAAHDNQQLRGQARSYHCIESSFSRSPVINERSILAGLLKFRSSVIATEAHGIIQKAGTLLAVFPCDSVANYYAHIEHIPRVRSNTFLT